MDLKMKDIIDLLEVPEKTIIQWINDKKMPSYKIKNQYFFNKAEVNEWILKNNIAVSEKILDLALTNRPVSLIDLIKKGDVHYGIIGSTVREVIDDVVRTIPIPKSADIDTVRASLLQREEMMTTAVGKGIALPHPRNPIISDIDEESVSICFLKNPIDYGALDGEPVKVLFIIISSNAKRHLEILSKISFLCKQEDFLKTLNDKPQKEVFLYYIERVEKEWRAR
ncbi:MAG TPA: PTS sugar transporter subunit IIA [Spirochaetota bacterium]|nr:PTS sugar transporter subunit IIA [Spirochaetota bacterium]HOD13202.1 PTS sugar transporter subunit IIA [Spirochaetota bacterium]HPG48991.1 PTS sugar transporter subunit IIA [Spirochaetota bacterium]HPN13975.1 PTS sugar transporter subunit IIA [Spirochaetota bacterium]